MVIVLAIAAIVASSAGAAPPEYVQQPSKVAVKRRGLDNVFAKLQAGKEVRIAYFGGSITAANGWRVKTLKWFQDRYPKAKVVEINAAIGGTGSDLGVYRCRQDVLSHKPDLIFVEFAVNDGGAEPINIWRSMEGIVRQAWAQDPNIDICYIYTMVTGFTGDYDKGMFPRATSADEMLAEYYGIPAVSVAYPTAQLAREGKLWYTPKKDDQGKEIAPPPGVIVWSDDGVHPRDAGHEIYAQCIEDQLVSWETGAKPQAHELKAPFIADNWEHAKLVPLQPSMLTPGWKQLSPTEGLGAAFHGFMPVIWSADKPGEKITFKFKGTAVKLYDLMGPTIAKAIVTLDGKTSTVTQFDQWCNYWRLATLNIADGLPNDVHTVTVEISPDQPDRKAVTDQFKNDPKFDPKAYDGTVMNIGSIMLIGEVNAER
jgi:lysophospholipase L1-like esterase